MHRQMICHVIWYVCIYFGTRTRPTTFQELPPPMMPRINTRIQTTVQVQQMGIPGHGCQDVNQGSGWGGVTFALLKGKPSYCHIAT